MSWSTKLGSSFLAFLLTCSFLEMEPRASHLFHIALVVFGFTPSSLLICAKLYFTGN